MYAWHQINSSCSLLVDALYGREKYSISIRKILQCLAFFKQAVYLSVGQFSLTFQEFFWHKQLCETAVKNINNKSF
jgi:hypothetical protein